VQEAGGLACGYDQQPVNLANRQVDIMAACNPTLLNDITGFMNRNN
jgi:hypothetical protein